MVLEEGRIIEFDKWAIGISSMSPPYLVTNSHSPSSLLTDSSSKFHALCKASGKDEFAMLKKMAGL